MTNLYDLYDNLRHHLRQRLRLLYFNLMTRIARNVILEHLTNHLHPDFGSEWREDGEFGKRLKQQEIEFNSKLVVMAVQLRDLRREQATWEDAVKTAYNNGIAAGREQVKKAVHESFANQRKLWDLQPLDLYMYPYPDKSEDTNLNDNQTP